MMTSYLMQLIERKMVAQTAVRARHVVRHVATDAIQVAIAVRHLPLVRDALMAVVVGAIQNVVEDVLVVVPLIVKEVVVRDVRAVVVHHALEPAIKVARLLVQANVVALHVQACVQTLVTEDSAMVVVLAHVSHPAREPAFIRAI
mgnify:CR=1 FL=1